MVMNGLKKITCSFVLSGLFLGVAHAAGPLTRGKAKPADLVRIRISYDELTWTFPNNKAKPHFVPRASEDNIIHQDPSTGMVVEEVTTNPKKLLARLAKDPRLTDDLYEILYNIEQQKIQLEAELKRARVHGLNLGARFDVRIESSRLPHSPFVIKRHIVDLNTGFDVGFSESSLCTSCKTASDYSSWTQSEMGSAENDIANTIEQIVEKQNEIRAAKAVVSGMEKLNGKLKGELFGYIRGDLGALDKELHEVTVRAKKLPLPAKPRPSVIDAMVVMKTIR